MTDSAPLFDSPLPESFLRRGNSGVPADQLVVEWGELDAARVEAAQTLVDSGEALGVSTPHIKRIRERHHRLAQIIATGAMTDLEAAALCGFAANRVAHLRRDPAFQELLAHYKTHAEAEFLDFVRAAADLGQDALAELQHRMDEDPEKFSNTQLMELVRTLADRTGHAPVQKSVSVNVAVDLASKLAAARTRRMALANPNGRPSDDQ